MRCKSSGGSHTLNAHFALASRWLHHAGDQMALLHRRFQGEWGNAPLPSEGYKAIARLLRTEKVSSSEEERVADQVLTGSSSTLG